MEDLKEGVAIVQVGSDQRVDKDCATLASQGRMEAINVLQIV